MKQQTIYEVAVIPIGSLNTIRQKETVFSYFSNLSKCLDQLTATLAINGWESKINYTAVYRSLKEKQKFVAEFGLAGNKIFKIVITCRTINPALTMLGIEEKPLQNG
jgi:hypothetical protein